MLEEVDRPEAPGADSPLQHGVAHKKGVGPGRFPKKAAKAILRVIESAKHNAEYKGLDAENMKRQGRRRTPGTDHPGLHAPCVRTKHPLEPADRQHRGHT